VQLPQANDFELTLAQICHKAIQQHPERILLQWQQSSFTVEEIITRASVIAKNLKTSGIKAGTAVGVMLDNHPNHVSTLLALGLLNVIWVPLDRRFKSANVQNVIALANVNLVIAEKEYRDVILGADPGCAVEYLEELILSTTDEPYRYTHSDIHPDDTRALMFTSGTTGAAKAVVVTERMYTGAALFCAYASQADSNANFYLWEPLNHIGGAQIIPMALLSGARVSMTERFSASRFWTEVIHYGANRIHYLGGILELLLANVPCENDREHQVTLAFGAGASTSVSAAFTQRFGIPLREVYGMTEAASFTTININGPTGSIGQPLPYFNLSLRDKNDAEVLNGEVGEIALSCPSVPLLTPRYHQNRKATDAAFREQRFYTGDLAKQDENGYLFFCGRLKDRIRCKGENVTAADVESVFNAHPMVVESAVIGFGENSIDQELLVFVQLVAERQVQNEQDIQQEIASWTDGQLASFEQPRYIMVVQDFEKTPSERIQKHKLPVNEVATRAWDRRSNKL
jgi:crotonobetaine/carnitine-CoA ligase